MIYQVFLLLFNSCLTLPELERAWWRHRPSQQCPVCWVPVAPRQAAAIATALMRNAKEHSIVALPSSQP